MQNNDVKSADSRCQFGKFLMKYARISQRKHDERKFMLKMEKKQKLKNPLSAACYVNRTNN